MVELIKGDLITLTREGHFDFVGHGTNCMCTMGAGIAPLMAKAFKVDKYSLETEWHRGDINKLGCIEAHPFILPSGKAVMIGNLYTQFAPGIPNEKYGIPLDYDALKLCFRKINHIYKGKKIGLPWIGCGLAGGEKGLVFWEMDVELKDCQVTIVEL